MLKILAWLLLFFAIAQPGVILPIAVDRPFLAFGVLTAALFILQRFLRGFLLTSLPQRKYIYAFGVVCALSLAQTGWVGGIVSTLVFWLKIVVTFTIVAEVNESTADVRRAVFAMVAAGVVLIWFGWDKYLNHPVLLQTLGRLESVGNYNLSNSFALVLTMGTALAIGLFETQRGILRKILLFALIGLFIYSDVYTKSRGGNFGLFGVVLLSIWFSSWVGSRAMKIALMAAVMVVGTALSVSVILSRTDVTDYFGNDVSTGDRMLAWVAASRMIATHPFLGVGWRQFPDHAIEYGHDHRMLAHNTILSVAAETGLTGGCLFILVLVTTIRGLVRVRQRTRGDPELADLGRLAQGVLICLVGYLINSSFSVKDADPMLWTTLSVAGSIMVVHSRALQDRTRRPPAMTQAASERPSPLEDAEMSFLNEPSPLETAVFPDARSNQFAGRDHP